MRLSIFLGAILLLAVPVAASAQAVSEAQSVQVALWPEYDRSDVLVIYRVALPASTTLPTTVRLLIPPDAPELTAAAYRDASGGLVNAASTRTDGDLADTVEIEARGTEVQLEFYLPLEISGDVRRFSFIWPGGLATQDFGYEVQQPIGATAMEVVPAATGQTTDDVGLTYRFIDLGPQTSAAQPEVSFTYSKSTSQLSVEAAAESGALATPAPASGTSLEFRSLLPWLLLLAGLGLIAVGVVYYLRLRSEDRPARPRRRSAKPPAEPGNQVDASPVFCHNCGTQATATDRFCRQCGTALRG